MLRSDATIALPAAARQTVSIFADILSIDALYPDPRDRFRLRDTFVPAYVLVRGLPTIACFASFPRL